VRRKAYMTNYDKLPPCPLRYRGKECTVECATNLEYRHNMIDCKIRPTQAGALT
jgi:hypothetical protein